MAIAREKTENPWATDPEERARMIEIALKVDDALGIPRQPTMTLEEIYADQKAHGVRPENNEASRELMRMRYGNDWEPTEEGE